MGAAFIATALLGAGGCKSLTVEDQNSGSLIDLQNNPNPTSLATAAQGLFIGNRLDVPLWLILIGSQGREGWSLDPSDPGWRNVLVIFDNTTFYAGSFMGWRDLYQNIKQASVVLKATDAVTGLTDAQKEGIRGFAKTLMALDFLNVINTRDQAGAVIAPNEDPAGAPGPVATRAETYAKIKQLLDQGKTHLAAAGTAFALRMSPGFAGFDTPGNFLKFNRALRARVAIYENADYATALTALGESFLSTSAPLTLGTYYSFSTNSGDKLPSPLVYDPSGRVLVGHPSLETDAQKQADGVTPDLRFTSKLIKLAAARSFNGLTSTLAFNVYSGPTAPFPIIRNEDLILLRAEALWFTGDKVNATADLNFIRQTAGGLPAIAQPADDAAFTDELLYNRRYSLLWEGGHRWIDARRFNRLTSLPIDRAATDHVFAYWPIPSDECINRTPQPPGCAQPTPFVK